ncbi:phosphoribosylanthranilate isomerase [Marinospirillum alkaliphilum]|uniref:N-(5'-phosphoribosyl)anthranilate isomerase n=1 Tax=Marinospirillum alkaliphilum DSM 21637 TaxID=1122209 RepID=A0A1K1X465_9GAMM|nr:phosphoribosylanthranilate isomerase [Marinospirillum alkaliphilum]SFX44319.1 phosphoribosylanthranilate isomerase [Marinospirillum alkaliphilum DSM 21637]
MRTRAKICGLTRLEDVQAVAEAGADAIGLVFYPPSPRNVSLELATLLASQLPPFITCVGLFVDPEPEWVEAVLAAVPLDLLQFHGNEPDAFCRSFARPYIKALRMKPGFDPTAVVDQWPAARGFLLDAYTPGVPGGTGESFDWQRFPQDQQRHWILAGGLDAGNVAEAIRIARPYAVDVSGGVESSRGIKCPTEIHAFMKAVRSQGVNA